MRWIFGFALVWLATAAIAGEARFSAIPVPSEPQCIWLLDTYTGALSRCEAGTLDASPICTPWTAAQGEQALYRYDPGTQKLIPMNDAAKRRDAASQNSKQSKL